METELGVKSGKPAVETSAADETVKQRIEKCALELFATKGYPGTSVREIVEAAGVTKPSLYYYFENKEQLYRSLILGSLDAFYAELAERLRARAPLAARLRAIAETYFAWMRAQPQLAAAIYRAVFGEAPQSRILDCEEHSQMEEAFVADLLREAAEAGEISPEAASSFAALQSSCNRLW